MQNAVYILALKRNYEPIYKISSKSTENEICLASLLSKETGQIFKG
jgi:hypothetical protein